MKALLAPEALSMAYWQRNLVKGLVRHSDCGTQYADYVTIVFVFLNNKKMRMILKGILFW